MLKLNEQALEMVSGGVKLIVRYVSGNPDPIILKVKFNDKGEHNSVHQHLTKRFDDFFAGCTDKPPVPKASKYLRCIRLSEFKRRLKDWLPGRQLVVEKDTSPFKRVISTWDYHFMVIS